MEISARSTRTRTGWDYTTNPVSCLCRWQGIFLTSTIKLKGCTLWSSKIKRRRKSKKYLCKRFFREIWECKCTRLKHWKTVRKSILRQRPTTSQLTKWSSSSYRRWRQATRSSSSFKSTSIWWILNSTQMTFRAGSTSGICPYFTKLSKNKRWSTRHPC